MQDIFKELVKEIYFILYPQDIVHSEKLNFAVRTIKAKKFPLPKQDMEEIEFPKDITNLTDNQITNLMGVYCRIIEYSQFETAKFEVERSNAKNTYKWEKSKRKVAISQIKTKKSDIELYLDADSKLRKLYEEYEQYNNLYILSKALLDGFKQNHVVLSRILSERISHRERKI
jgi:hypothetical protein